jgi:hypothetical protein
MWRVTRRGDEVDYEDMGGCRFVKLVGEVGMEFLGARDYHYSE